MSAATAYHAHHDLHLARLGINGDVLRIDQIGAGRALWLAMRPAAITVGFATTSQRLSIHECGSGIVDRLRITNRSSDPVLVPAHLILRGGRQTRAVERGVIAPPLSQLDVPVKCVEQGRWSREPLSSSFEPGQSHITSLTTRRAMGTLTRESYGLTGQYTADQSRVWTHVKSQLDAHGVRSSTSSYGAYTDSVCARYTAAATASGVSPPPMANALLRVFDVAGGGFAFDGFPTPYILCERAPSILADLFDPNITTAQRPRRSENRDRERDPFAVLRNLELTRVPPVAGSIGEPFIATSDGVVGEVLVLEGALAHASIASL